MKNSRLKKIINLENILYMFIIISPILDIASFIFRNYFGTSLSISTVLRPVLPIIAITYIFFKDKIKCKLLTASLMYGLYAALHLYVFYLSKTECAYGNIIRELQYVINYTFMVMNLFLYLYVFIFRKKKIDDFTESKIEKMKKAILISFTLYILLMFVAILTGTSSHTYKEDAMGYKGWFESGNSVGAIMILMLFTILPLLKNKNSKVTRILALINVILSGIYLTTLLGTRVGLLGFALVILTYIICEVLVKLRTDKKLNKKIVGIGATVFVVALIAVIFVGQNFLSRRKLLKEREDLIYDESLGTSSHVTGDILKMVEQIKLNEMAETYMSVPMQKALIDLYDFNNSHNVPYTNMRITQLVYHTALVMEQKNICTILFGNGFMTHYRELIFEMEVPAFLYNFGIYGFILYFVPFATIAIYGVYVGMKNIKQIDVDVVMSILGVNFAILVSFLSGYTFFNQSTVTIIIVTSTIAIYNIIKLKGENSEKENNIWNNKPYIRGRRTSISRYSKQTSGKI